MPIAEPFAARRSDDPVASRRRGRFYTSNSRTRLRCDGSCVATVEALYFFSALSRPYTVPMAMQSTHGADEPATKKRRMEDGGSEEDTIRQRIYHDSTVSDNARAQFGGQYHSYHGPVYQNATSVAPLTGCIERKIADALRFDGMDVRRATVKLPSGNTCLWFFDSPEYKEWRDLSIFAEHHGFLWIRGKPGAGKSTLMRLAVKHADQDFPNDLRISFFFNAKGTSLEKSVEGMYRTLLYQLLVQCPRLEEVFHKRPWDHTTWPVELLEEHFRDCVLQLGARELTCHIDALDECEESDVRGLIEFFEDLGSMAISAGVQMHVCFASRHYPRISISRCVDLVLDNLQGHQEDIETYVRNNLKVAELALRDQFASDIRARARDVFLWVVLVVRLLNKESDQGNSHILQAQLDAIPSGLHDLFENAIIERGIGDSRYLLPILLWILYATRPLSPPELYHAVLYARNDMNDAVVLDHTLDPSQIERFILNTSKGLAEITVPKDKDSEDGDSQSRVQFIHETVREYLQNSGISRLENSFCNNPTGLCHDFLKSRCADYMSLAAPFIQRFEGSKKYIWHARQGRHECIGDKFPFVRYAVGVESIERPYGGMVAHAELAQVHGISQASFVDSFPLDLVIELTNLAGTFHGSQGIYYRSATKTYIFALLDAPQLLQLELDRLNGGDEHRSSVNASAAGTADIGAVLHSPQGDLGTPLHAAIYTRNFRIIKLLLKYGSDVNARGGASGTALEIAAMMECDDMDIVELLFQYGADVNARVGGKTALQVAASGSNLNMVRLFLEHGADVNAQGGRAGSALQIACCDGDLEVVKCLVERGANINAKAKGARDVYGTALQAARSRRKQKTVDYLLKHGARDER
jgi:hypothetical protein